MIPQKQPFASQAAMIFLAVTLSFISVLGNGSFMAIFARFKMFRNFPNILFINLALIDFLNALVNVPLFVMYFVLQTIWLTGKTWAVISSSLNLELSLLNLVSMSVLMLDRFLAVYLDLKYFTWKTPKKAKIAVFLMWLFCTILVVIFSVPLLEMDFGGKPLIVSRGKIFRERKLVLKLLMALFTITSTVLGSLTGYFIHQKKKQVRKDIYWRKKDVIKCRFCDQFSQESAKICPSLLCILLCFHVDHKENFLETSIRHCNLDYKYNYIIPPRATKEKKRTKTLLAPSLCLKNSGTSEEQTNSMYEMIMNTIENFDRSGQNKNNKTPLRSTCVNKQFTETFPSLCLCPSIYM